MTVPTTVPSFGVVDDGTFALPDEGSKRSGAQSPLAALEQDLQAETARPPVTLKVRPRRLVALRLKGELDPHVLEAWQDRFTTKKGTPQARVDMTSLAAVAIANLTDAVCHAETGEPIEGADGQVLTFRHPEFLRMLGAEQDGAMQGVRNLFGKDQAAMLVMLNEALENAGYTVDGSERVDPTAATGS